MNQEELNRQLLEAAEKGDTDRIWELVELGADINAGYESEDDEDDYMGGKTALIFLAEKRKITPKYLDTFISRGADINAKDYWDDTVLMHAASRGHLTPELLEAFVSHGADVNARDENGRTALMGATWYGHLTPELLEALVSIGADVNASDEWGNTALIMSAYNGHLTPELLEALVSRGADINAQDKDGWTALMLSARSGSLTPELLEALVSRGADASACDSDGDTALMWSALKGYLTPELARAFAEQFIRLGTPLEKIQKQLPASKETPAILVPVLIDKLETEPGLVVDFMKKHVGKKLQEWVDNGVEGADILVSRLVPYMEKRAAEVGGMGIEFF